MAEVHRVDPGQASHHLAQAATHALNARAASDPFIAGDVDVDQLARDFASAHWPTWAIRNGDTVVSHLYGNLFAAPGESMTSWTGLDGWSLAEADHLDELLTHAFGEWRTAGATRHVVWVPCAEASLWARRGYAPLSYRATVERASLRPSPTPGILRRATLEDIEVVIALDALIDAAQGNAASGHSGNSAVIRRELVDLITDPDMTFFVFEVDGVIVGQCALFEAPELRGTLPHSLQLSEVAIAAGYQGRGLGRAMVLHALSVVDDGRATTVDVRYRAINRTAEAFWTSMGFRPTVVQMERGFA